MRGAELTHHNQSLNTSGGLRSNKVRVWWLPRRNTGSSDVSVLCWTLVEKQKSQYLERMLSQDGPTANKLLLCDAIAQDFCQIPILLSIECRLILFFWCGRLQNNGSEIFGLSVLFQIGTPANNHSTSTLDADILVVCSMLHYLHL